ncbi:helix-turn-helix transcriptional regulator [Gracilibacillus salinarum]|uniref:Transcriptional regulator n=1 Tax=Gracilibacillus salinarum TaxID=2932255 RepID=A0ABY4GIX4_9BACI|nr:metalloregulator ArsR/SmtB family transcription factor [Gracilibacillus salinarum]UOQ84151.1 transcriptional regulator [Gracilibacillus salinarum]
MHAYKQTTKDQILEILKKEVSLSVNEIITHINITHMAIRKHLTTLEKDGLVTYTHVKKEIGRPLQRYHLTEKGKRLFPSNYETISMEFLKDIEETYGKDAVTQLFKNREARQSSQYGPFLTTYTPKEKMQHMINIQNEKGYMAELKQEDDLHFEMVEYNCPIFSVARAYNVACQCETNMFKQVLGTENIERTQCKTDGDNHCKFKVKFEDSSSTV